jgi:hypothetical protein
MDRIRYIEDIVWFTKGNEDFKTYLKSLSTEELKKMRSKFIEIRGV